MPAVSSPYSNLRGKNTLHVSMRRYATEKRDYSMTQRLTHTEPDSKHWPEKNVIMRNETKDVVKRTAKASIKGELRVR